MYYVTIDSTILFFYKSKMTYIHFIQSKFFYSREMFNYFPCFTSIFENLCATHNIYFKANFILNFIINCNLDFKVNFIVNFDVNFDANFTLNFNVNFNLN